MVSICVNVLHRVTKTYTCVYMHKKYKKHLTISVLRDNIDCTSCALHTTSTSYPSRIGGTHGEKGLFDNLGLPTDAERYP